MERFPLLVENLASILDGARGETLAGGGVDASTIDAALASLREWGERPDAAFWFSMSWAEGVKPA